MFHIQHSIHFCKRPIRLSLAAIVMLIATVVCADETAKTLDTKNDDSRDVSFARVTADLKTLASDEMGGRLPGTPEIELAAEYIIEQYKSAGLKPGNGDSYRQVFTVGGTRTIVKEKSALVLNGPDGTKLEFTIDEQFIPQMANADVNVSAGVVFVGYGITAEELNFDEYRDVDVAGKVVIFIRNEPQQNNANSVFDGTDTSRHAFLNAKVSTAQRLGATAIFMVNDSVTAAEGERDELSDPTAFGRTVARMPFAHVKRDSISQLLAISPIVAANGDKLTSLKQIESAIDENLNPVSQELTGWTADFKVAYERKGNETSNIVGVIEGEGPLAHETIVIGGHYDHLGKGAYGSRTPNRKEIHNGADDNATGTCAVIELGRRFARMDERPARRLVFICFSAEEAGLLGAQHYCSNPLFPLEDTVAMFNYDMIGSMSNKRLTCYSWNSADEFGDLLKKANEGIGLSLETPPGGFGASDHAAFQARNIPVIFFHTGLTPTYHTPDDTFETINLEGMFETINLSEKFVASVIELEKRPTLSSGGSRRPPRVTFGAIVVGIDGEPGVKIVEMESDSMAAKTGFKVGDIILMIGDKNIVARRDVQRELQNAVGEKVKVKVKRGDEIIEIEVEPVAD